MGSEPLEGSVQPVSLETPIGVNGRLADDINVGPPPNKLLPRVVSIDRYRVCVAKLLPKERILWLTRRSAAKARLS